MGSEWAGAPKQTGAPHTEKEHHGAGGACEGLGPQPGPETPADEAPSHGSPPPAPLVHPSWRNGTPGTPPAPMAQDEYDVIRDDIRHHMLDDPALLPDLFWFALSTLGSIAITPADDGIDPRARQALRDMVQRAVLGPVDQPEDHYR
jgi:hypothetical protein